MSWSPVSDADLAGYRVYYGTSSRSYAQARGAGLSTDKLTQYNVGGLQSGRTYYFSVTSYDGAGNESGYSAEVSQVAQ